MNSQKTDTKKEPRIIKTFREDFRQSRLKDNFRTEYKDLKLYFLSEERRKKLRRMNPLKKFFVLPWWISKAMYFRLTPFRRILFFVGLIFLLTSGSVETGPDGTTVSMNISAIFTGLIFLFILALELKDKLLAKTELAEGRAIQQSLMPEQSPEVPGWDIWLYTRSANDVGGDLIDFIQINEYRFGIALGDVAGKGLSAALFMAKLQSSIRALVYDSPSLTQLAEKLNKIFHRDSLPKIFASLIYVELESGSDKLKLINAGHYPPFIIQKDSIKKLSKDAPALGLMKDALFSEQSIQLNENDCMVIYSDGLTEAQNDKGEFFGEERLITMLKQTAGRTSEQIAGSLLSDVEAFIGNAPVHDDLTLAVLRKIR